MGVSATPTFSGPAISSAVDRAWRGVALAWPEVLPRSAGSGLGGSFLDSSRARLADWPSTLGFLLFFQGPLAFAAFVAGLAAAKADFFTSGGQARYRLGKATPWLFVVAITLNAFYAATDGGWLWSDDGSLALSGLCALSLGAKTEVRNMGSKGERTLSAVWQEMLSMGDDPAYVPPMVAVSTTPAFYAFRGREVRIMYVHAEAWGAGLWRVSQ